MHIEEDGMYRVQCHVSRKDLHQHGIMVDDLVNRTPLGRMFLQKASELSKASMDYEWPHCAFSTEMKFYPEDIVLVFSERVDDYLYSLRQSAAALDEEQAQGLMSLIQAISLAEEEEGREMIRRFEENVRREGGQK